MRSCFHLKVSTNLQVSVEELKKNNKINVMMLSGTVSLNTHAACCLNGNEAMFPFLQISK